ncbi:MAG: hypothetical protein KAS04_04620 [Candidatus Aenigmarchaeota archaeon]|nr:hypothetical protein [Candidatus Aenigmarchaeota archaeon]
MGLGKKEYLSFPAASGENGFVEDHRMWVEINFEMGDCNEKLIFTGSGETKKEAYDKLTAVLINAATDIKKAVESITKDFK